MNGFDVAISAARLHLLSPTCLKDEFPNIAPLKKLFCILQPRTTLLFFERFRGEV
jgi:hypothetical protein